MRAGRGKRDRSSHDNGFAAQRAFRAANRIEGAELYSPSSAFRAHAELALDFLQVTACARTNAIATYIAAAPLRCTLGGGAIGHRVPHGARAPQMLAFMFSVKADVFGGYADWLVAIESLFQLGVIVRTRESTPLKHDNTHARAQQHCSCEHCSRWLLAFAGDIACCWHRRRACCASSGRGGEPC